MNKPTRLLSWTRLRAHLPYKLTLAVGLNVWALLPYYLLQHYPLYPITKMPPGPLDHWIPFQEHSIWLYLSLFLLQPLAPAQMLHLTQLKRYALGVIVISGIANSIFWLWPTAITRPAVPIPSLLYQCLLTYVTPLNACPSLHAAMAVYSALCWEQLCAGTPRAWVWRSGVWLWALGILYATLSTKEHVVIDALTGSLLGLGTYWMVFRNERKKPCLPLPQHYLQSYFS